MNIAKRLTQYIFELPQNIATFERQALQRRANNIPLTIGQPLPRALAKIPNAGRHIPGRTKIGVIRIDKRREPIRFHRQPHQLFPRIILPRQSPHAAALLHNPQPRNIFQKSNRMINTALIGKIVCERALINRGFRQLRTHQRPCATTDINRIGRRKGHSRNRRPRIVTSRSNHVNRCNTHLIRNALAHGTKHCTRRHHIRKHIRGNSQRIEHCFCPGILARIVELRGRRIGILTHLHTRKPEIEQIGHREKRTRNIELRRLRETLREQLIQRVKLHKLNTRLLKNLLARNPLKRDIHHPLCARIAITKGIAEQIVLRVEQAIIDPPRITAHAIERFPRPNSETQPRTHLVKQPQRIPIIMIANRYPLIGKPVNLFNIQTRAIKTPQNSPTAGRTQIISEIIGCRCHKKTPSGCARLKDEQDKNQMQKSNHTCRRAYTRKQR